MANMFMPPAIPSITIAGRVFTDVENLMLLKSYAEGTTNIRGTARKQNASAGYQVPVGKKFVIKAVRVQATNTASNANQVAIVGYADNDVGIAASTAFTNPVYPAGSSTAGAVGAMTAISNVVQEFLLNFEVPAGKYVGIVAVATAVNYITVEIYGYEVPA